MKHAEFITNVLTINPLVEIKEKEKKTKKYACMGSSNLPKFKTVIKCLLSLVDHLLTIFNFKVSAF